MNVLKYILGAVAGAILWPGDVDLVVVKETELMKNCREAANHYSQSHINQSMPGVPWSIHPEKAYAQCVVANMAREQR